MGHRLRPKNLDTTRSLQWKTAREPSLSDRDPQGANYAQAGPSDSNYTRVKA
jgi:hypothetical protein